MQGTAQKIEAAAKEGELQKAAILIRCLPAEFKKFHSEIESSLPCALDGGHSNGIAGNSPSTSPEPFRDLGSDDCAPQA